MRVDGLWFGPELVWLVLLGVQHALALLNRPPSEAGNRWMTRLGFVWMTLGVAAAFALWPFVSYGKGWLLLRAVVSSSVGGLWSSFVWTGSIDYQNSRNSGLLALWVLYVMAGAGTLLLCLIAGLIAWGFSR